MQRGCDSPPRKGALRRLSDCGAGSAGDREKDDPVSPYADDKGSGEAGTEPSGGGGADGGASGRGTGRRVLVVRKPENLAKFSSGANTYNAPLVMLVCSDLNEAWVRPYDGKNMVDIDASIITDHMMLTATELGLGTCWITYFDPKAIRAAFKLPENQIGRAHV